MGFSKATLARAPRQRGEVCVALPPVLNGNQSRDLTPRSLGFDEARTTYPVCHEEIASGGERLAKAVLKDAYPLYMSS